MPTRLQLSKKDIVSILDASGHNVFSHNDLGALLKEYRQRWRLAQTTTVNEFIQYLSKNSHLRQVTFTSKDYGSIVRYVWKSASPFELAVSLKKSSYLSHGTAVFLHGLTDQRATTVYVNKEQSPKPAPKSPLTQDALNRAFARRQRASKYIFKLGEHRYVVLSGKHTGQLGVEQQTAPDGAVISATNIERTLIDIIVRPAYAGGVYEVLGSYKAALGRVSVSRLLAILKQLGYMYPYHQAIGFLLERAGYPGNQVERLHRLGTEFDFFLGYGIKNPSYSSKWRLFYPQGF
jgi:predicted transcriptional regulator of viral defense system